MNVLWSPVGRSGLWSPASFITVGRRERGSREESPAGLQRTECVLESCIVITVGRERERKRQILRSQDLSLLEISRHTDIRRVVKGVE